MPGLCPGRRVSVSICTFVPGKQVNLGLTWCARAATCAVHAEEPHHDVVVVDAFKLRDALRCSNARGGRVGPAANGDAVKPAEALKLHDLFCLHLLVDRAVATTEHNVELSKAGWARAGPRDCYSVANC
jgi:hypothetical protein